MSGVVLHLPEEESVVLSAAVVRRLLRGDSGDAALLYLAVLQRRGGADDEKLRQSLGWSQQRFDAALSALRTQGLVSTPGTPAPRSAPPQPSPADRRPEYTRADMARALEGGEFAALTAEVEQKLGKRLTTPDLSILLGLYDYVGLPSDVIFLLVGFCLERAEQRYGPGRRPTMRQIEREGYAWARMGLMTQERSAAYIKKYISSRQGLPRLMALLRLGDRPPSPTEERYLLSWQEMGFDQEVLELAYDKTILKCKELKWPYMDRILQSWHQKGLHTLAQVEQGDRPGGAAPRPAGSGTDAGAVRENLARMERYRRELRGEHRDKEGS